MCRVVWYKSVHDKGEKVFRNVFVGLAYAEVKRDEGYAVSVLFA